MRVSENSKSSECQRSIRRAHTWLLRGDWRRLPIYGFYTFVLSAVRGSHAIQNAFWSGTVPIANVAYLGADGWRSFRLWADLSLTVATWPYYSSTLSEAFNDDASIRAAETPRHEVLLSSAFGVDLRHAYRRQGQVRTTRPAAVGIDQRRRSRGQGGVCREHASYGLMRDH